MSDDPLDRRDFNGATWARLETHLRARIADLRQQNDRPQNTEQQTDTLRGRILELKELLALPQAAPVEDASPE
jgi:hypothetical protein